MKLREEDSTAPLFPADAVPPCPGAVRPPHYFVVTIFPGENDEDDDEYLCEPFDEVEDPIKYDPWEQGVFDNWDGTWVVEPEFADQIEMAAEGSATQAAFTMAPCGGAVTRVFFGPADSSGCAGYR